MSDDSDRGRTSVHGAGGAMAKRLLGILGRSLAIAAALILIGVTMFQDRLLYFPEPATVAEMLSPGLIAWPMAEDFRGLLAEPVGFIRGTAIVFHGNAGHAGHRGVYADALTQQGLRVILAEYPAYGPRAGALGEESLVADAALTIDLAYRQYGAPVLLIGESLGAGVAAAAAVRRPDEVAGLLLITPWDSLARVAAHHYPWLPVGWLLRDRYESAGHLRAFGRPVMVALAARDSIVPARFGGALYDALSVPRRLALIPGAEHNDWADRVDAGWWLQAIDFLLGKEK